MTVTAAGMQCCCCHLCYPRNPEEIVIKYISLQLKCSELYFCFHSSVNYENTNKIIHS